MDKPFILDPCCGSKMFYHDKESDAVMFCNIRELRIVGTLIWKEFPYEILLLDKGWVYRTRKEAEDALPKVATEMRVKYKV